MCAAMGCCSTSHFGCAVLDKWSFYSENIPLCGSCAVSPAAKACGGLGNALAPINLYKLTSRHLRVMPHKPNKAVCNAAAGTASGGQAGYSAHSAAFHTSTIPATTSTQQEPPQTLSSLKGEQWGLYQESVRGGLINVKGGLIQQASMMPRIGALTVLRLGVVKTDQRHHPDQAIYPIGYTSNRVCFAPGEIQTKSSIARPRALYTCQILAGEHGGPPHFKVAVGAEVCYASSTSEAWQRATRRSMRSLKTGDCMFGVTLQPIARILWAAGAGGGERESQETIVENHPLSIKKRKIGSSYDDQS